MVLSCADGGAYSMMVGCGEAYISAFALAVGLGQITAGLVGTVPLLIGGILQLVGPRGAAWCGSYRRWVVGCATMQGASFIPLAYGAWHGNLSALALFATCAIYWGFGMAAGPAWNSWIDRLIPQDTLRPFFTLRARLTQLAAFLAFLGAGYVLVAFQTRGEALAGFATLFITAAGWRLISCICLRLQTDAPMKVESGPKPKLSVVARKLYTAQSSRFLVFLLASQVGVHIGGAFFAPYMLAKSGFPYYQYVALVGMCYLAKIITLPILSGHIHRFGSYRSLFVAALGISPLPLTWLIAPQFQILLVIQFFAGVAWAAFELSSTLLIFERINGEERMSMLTVFNLLNAVAIVTGSLIGGAGIKLLPTAYAYPVVFTLSTVTRLAAGALLWRPRRMHAPVQATDPAPEEETSAHAA